MSSLSHKAVNGDRYVLLKSVTAGVHLQEKGKVDAVCSVHRVRQQGSKQCPHSKQKPVSCAGVNHWRVSVYYQLLSLWQWYLTGRKRYSTTASFCFWDCSSLCYGTSVGLTSVEMKILEDLALRYFWFCEEPFPRYPSLTCCWGLSPWHIRSDNRCWWKINGKDIQIIIL